MEYSIEIPGFLLWILILGSITFAIGSILTLVMLYKSKVGLWGSLFYMIVQFMTAFIATVYICVFWSYSTSGMEGFILIPALIGEVISLILVTVMVRLRKHFISIFMGSREEETAVYGDEN